MQMFLLHLSYCDFFVCCPTGVQLTRIPINVRFILGYLLPSIQHFYSNILLPSVVWFNLGYLLPGNIRPVTTHQACDGSAIKEFQLDALMVFPMIANAVASSTIGHVRVSDFAMSGVPESGDIADKHRRLARLFAVLTIESREIVQIVHRIEYATDPLHVSFSICSAADDEVEDGEDLQRIWCMFTDGSKATVVDKPYWWNDATTQLYQQVFVKDAIRTSAKTGRIQVELN